MSQPNSVGAVARESMTKEQREMEQFFENMYGSSPVRTTVEGEKVVVKNANGDWIGPYALFVRFPEFGQRLLELFEAVRNLGGTEVGSDIEQLMLVTVHGITNSPYQIYAHSRISIDCGFTWEQINTLTEVKFPESLEKHPKSKSYRAAFEMVREMITHPGPLPKRIWDLAVEAVGVDGASAMVFLSSEIIFRTAIVNGFDTRLPPQAEIDAIVASAEEESKDKGKVT